MTILLYPADEEGCGNTRLIWPGELLKSRGADIIVDRPGNRQMMLKISHPENDPRTQVLNVILPDGVDCVVMQRPTHVLMAQTVVALRRQGVAVVVDIDDDLLAIHPGNAAWLAIHPNKNRQALKMQGFRGAQLDALTEHYNRTDPQLHTPQNVTLACSNATMVTVSTRRLLRRYAAHGRGQVLPNYLAPHFFGHTWQDQPLVGWPAALHSHPNDPAAAGNGLRRFLQNSDWGFAEWGPPEDDVAAAFGVPADRSRKMGIVRWPDYPASLAQLGIAICPLADTGFNEAKSWLKPLELSAAGVPWIASPRQEYRRLHQLGAGMLAGDGKDWFRALQRLAGSEAARAELSEAGVQVAHDLSLERRAWEYLDAWEQARKLQRDS